jgi:hypothetical protein
MSPFGKASLELKKTHATLQDQNVGKTYITLNPGVVEGVNRHNWLFCFNAVHFVGC